MSLILRDLKPGDLFKFHPDGLEYEYLGSGWGWATGDNRGNPVRYTGLDEVVFRSEAV